ncbi:AI-2E family transporter [Cyclobacterium marinum]|uniref:AI-2E family transporter n=1 Tax=Cyclobacterium marinum TaxID=104 RepID=UPI0011ECADA9|nr:AI-2E family transporter [Cyclobacterium marinum]MBI0397665.1 AI-2E family transporter [Cyclobacterium marinum]
MRKRNTRFNPIVLSALIIIALYFLVLGLMAAQKVLAPLVLAWVLALLVYPIAQLLEKKGLHCLLSTSFVVGVVFVAFIGISGIISLQVRSFLEDADVMKERLSPVAQKVELFVLAHTPLERSKLEAYKTTYGLNDDADRPKGKVTSPEVAQEEAFLMLGKVLGTAADFLLMFVYLFFFIHFRHMFYTFFIKLFPDSIKNNVSRAMNDSARVVRHYLNGRLILMVILVVLYSLGMWISGAEDFFLISFIAAFLSLIPFIGNMAGYVLALFIGLLSGGEVYTLVGITVTFLIVQFLDSYVFQPIILGNKVNVHPFFIILAVIIGNAIWGILGMVLSIPIIAIITVILRETPDAKAFTYLLSNGDDRKK